MKPILILSTPALCAAAALCGAQIRPNPQALPFKVLQSGQYSNVQNPGIVEFTDARSFARYWASTMNARAGTEPQGIDFARDKVLMVHLGRRNTGGYRFYMSNLEQGRDGSTIVRAMEQTPQPGSFVTQTITSPWILLRVDPMLRSPKLSVNSREPFNGNMIVTSPGRNEPRGNRCRCTDCQCDCGCGG